MDDDIFLFVTASFLCLTSIYLKRKYGKKNRKIWVNSYLRRRRSDCRYSRDFHAMSAHPNSFRENFHMDDQHFEYIFNKVKHHLEPIRYSRPDVICPRAKLAMVLEFFACGSLQRHIASNYRVSKQAMGNIIDKVCDGICAEMKEELPKLSKEKWLDVSNAFNAKWNFPNCVGAIDGKHVAIKCPRNSGSLFYNYKKFHSIVLMAVADAHYKFLYIDVGAYGSEGDASVFAASDFGKNIVQNIIDLPQDTEIGGIKMPFVFVADDAFPLVDRIMKPFSPPRGGTLSDEEKVFNYRLSRARRCVENAFGILCSKFICLNRTLFCSPERAQKITAACCVLHNYFLANLKSTYCPPNLVDHYGKDGNLIEGDWRKQARRCTTLKRSNQTRLNESARIIREIFKKFVNSVSGALSWQRRAVYLE